MKRLRSNQRGAVSIFLLLVLLTIFFFQAVLIDYARVMVAMKQSEDHLRSGVRSVMSAYDVVLKELYGLYATKEEEKLALLEDILQINSGTHSGFFNLIDLSYDTASINLSFDRPLGNSVVFQQQILEEMKYKAPIDFTLDLIDKLSPISLALGEASSTVRALKDMKDLYEEREDELRSALENQQNAYDIINRSLYELMTSKDTIFSEYPAYMSAMNELSASLEEGNEEDEESLLERARRIEDASRIVQQYRLSGTDQLDTLHHFVEQHDIFLRQAIVHIEQAKSINNQMRTRMANAQNDRSEAYDIVQRETLPQDGGSSEHRYTEQTTDVKQSIEGIIAEDLIFEELENRAIAQLNQLEGLTQRIGELEEVFHTIIAAEGAGEGRENELNRLKNSIVDRVTNYSLEVSELLTQQLKQLDQLHENREASKELEKRYEMESEQTSVEISRLIQRFRDFQGSKEDFEAVHQLYQNYLAANSGSATELDHWETDSKPDKLGDSAMKRTDSLFSVLGQMVISMRDELYLNEYTLSRFTFYDLKEVQDILLSESGEQNKPLELKEQEVEYILYGLQSPTANIAAALSEIFALRLAINSLDALTQCAKAGHPFAVLACVLASSFGQTLQDIKSLIQGNPIKLTRRVPILLTYEDHLQLFLFLHSRTDHIHRIQALIHHNTSQDLFAMFTYSAAQADASIRLWFIPGVIEAISYTGAIQGKVDRGRYYITKQAYLSY